MYVVVVLVCVCVCFFALTSYEILFVNLLLLLLFVHNWCVDSTSNLNRFQMNSIGLFSVALLTTLSLTVYLFVCKFKNSKKTKFHPKTNCKQKFHIFPFDVSYRKHHTKQQIFFVYFWWKTTRRYGFVVHTVWCTRSASIGPVNSGDTIRIIAVRSIALSLSISLNERQPPRKRSTHSFEPTRLDSMRCVFRLCALWCCVLRCVLPALTSSLFLSACTLKHYSVFRRKKKKIFSWTATFTCTAKIIVFSISIKIISIVCLPRVDKTGWHHSYGIIFDKIFHNSPKYRAADSGVWW